MLSELVAGSVVRVCFETCYGWQVGECSRRDRCHRAAGAVKRNERSVNAGFTDRFSGESPSALLTACGCPKTGDLPSVGGGLRVTVGSRGSALATGLSGPAAAPSST